jgi:CBS domain containing-hemolysin-like protein
MSESNGAAAASPRPRIFERLRQALRRRGTPATRDELETALAGNETEEGDFSPQERSMLRNVLDLRSVRVDDVMVPRVDIVAVAIDISLGDLLRTFREASHSRLPVHGETLDDPRGMVHIRDFVDYLSSNAMAQAPREAGVDEAGHPRLGLVDLKSPLAAANILRPVLYVPPSMSAIDLLVKMQATRTHMALVIDEYGGTDGLVSIEDLVEVIVGDIDDEHDEVTRPKILAEKEGVYLADARAPLEEVSSAIGVDLFVAEAADEIDTIGGLVVTLAGRVPSRGEIIAGPGNLEFEILDADARRVARLRIHPRKVPAAAPAKRVRQRDPAASATPTSDQPPAKSAAATPPPAAKQAGS